MLPYDIQTVLVTVCVKIAHVNKLTTTNALFVYRAVFGFREMSWSFSKIKGHIIRLWKIVPSFFAQNRPPNRTVFKDVCGTKLDRTKMTQIGRQSVDDRQYSVNSLRDRPK
jgi:hypothetical protein